jgi:hypothetical protein
MITFASFRLGDCEDPEIYAAGPIIEWEKSEQGQWVMANAVETPSYRICNDTDTYGYRVDIYGKLHEQDEIIYRLKYGFPSSNNR